MSSIRTVYKIIPLLAIVAIFSQACDKDNNHPGYTYYPDMAYSQAYETYYQNPNFADGSSMRQPVEGTVPRGAMPYPYKKSDEDRKAAGLALTNPIDLNDTTLARGKERYDFYCLQCHGEIGDGNGPLYTSGRYPYPPASLLTPTVQEVPEGEIFHVITVGHGIMGPHYFIVQPDDRWKITHYIREELSKNITEDALAELP